MTVKRGQEYRVTIDDLVFGGRGLVRIDGLAVFVDQAAPGDEATIRVYKKKKITPRPGSSICCLLHRTGCGRHVPTAGFVGDANGSFSNTINSLPTKCST